MKEPNAKQVRVETVSALDTVMEAQADLDSGYAAYIGLDVHKEAIAVAKPARNLHQSNLGA